MCEYTLLLASFLCVAFGQPAWIPILGLLASAIGYAFFFRVLIGINSTKKRFLTGFLWFAAIQVVQFSWVFSHPFFYIYFVLLLVSSFLGIQWGLLSVFIKKKSVTSIPFILALSGLWVLLEWSRSLVFSGLPFNPVGLALSGNLFSMQIASLIGVLGLSFWILCTNLFILRAWISTVSEWKWGLALLFLLFPYFFGWEHVNFHKKGLESSDRLNVVLVETALPIDESNAFKSADQARKHILNKWRQVLIPLKKQLGKPIDLLVFPEYVVPYGTFSLVYPEVEVQRLFNEIFGEISFAYPSMEGLYKELIVANDKKEFFVSNGYIVQTLVNLFHANVLIGLEDSVYEQTEEGVKRSETYTAAFYFTSETNRRLPQRYEKRVLVPMGEYIPFKWCRTHAARYGITGSFTPGVEAKVFQGKVPFGLSICYEEMFSGLMCENRMKGAEILVNLTNDGWFPSSRLPKQHFDHARLRTVENGIPLIRACNTGITGAVDSLGQITKVIENDNLENLPQQADSIYIEVPQYYYRTIYSLFGDSLILILSIFFLLTAVIFHWKK